MSPSRLLHNLLQFRVMSGASVTVRYDGPILAGHQMDVADLAPSLLALSDLCKLANKKFNGDRAAVKVMVDTDREHQCFQFDIHIVQSVWDATKALMGNADVASAKELLEWLGIIGVPTTIGVGVFKALRLIRDRKVTGTKLIVQDGQDVYQINVEGDNNVVIVSPQTLKLLQDEAVVENAKKVVAPVVRDGYDKLEFQDPKSNAVEKIDKEDAIAIRQTDPKQLEASEKEAPQTLEAWITVYSPIYDTKAKHWRFKFGKVNEHMDISETQIAADAMKRGGALVDDAYRVRLEITQELKESGKIVNHYKVKEVIDFRPSRHPIQSDAFKVDPNEEKED
jgi:hypothetical protein